MTSNGTLVVYLCAEDQDWLLVPSGDGTQDSYTRVIQESYSWSSGEAVCVGERLTKHEIVGALERRVIPSEWVVTTVEEYESAIGVSGFGAVMLAYCERQPLTETEVEERSYIAPVQVPVSV